MPGMKAPELALRRIFLIRPYQDGQIAQGEIEDGLELRSHER